MKRPKAAELLALARQDLPTYCVAMYPPFQLARHHAVIVDRLEAVERGELRRLMIFLPPRHGKSLLATQLFPSWYLGRHPDREVITACYGQELADDFGRKVRNYASDSLHQVIFPECKVSSDSASMRRFNTTAGGSYYAVGRGGPITGRGSHLLLIDDPLKDAEEARSEATRRDLHEWYQHVAYTRLAPQAAIVIIQTRWHLDDLAGWLLREHPEEPWEVLSMPAIAEQDEGFRAAGEALWPERFSLEALRQIRESIGGAAWSALYQQNPVAAEGAIFKREWWRTYREVPKFLQVVQSWDTAFKTGQTNDYSVCSTWAWAEDGFYLLHVWRARAEFPELKRIFGELATQWKPNTILVEDRASGQSLIQELRRGTSMPVLALKTDGDKIARAEACTPLIETGKVFLPEGEPWLSSYLDELATFPAGPHDDQVDSTTQALNYLREKSMVNFGLMEYTRQLAETVGAAAEQEF